MDGEMRRLRRRNCATGIGNKNKVEFEMTGIQRVVKKAGRTSAGKKNNRKYTAVVLRVRGQTPLEEKYFSCSIVFFILFYLLNVL